MAQITMDAEKVREMCTSAIEYYAEEAKKIPESIKEYALSDKERELTVEKISENNFNKRVRLDNIKRLTGFSSDVIWVSDSDMELLSKKLDKQEA